MHGGTVPCAVLLWERRDKVERESHCTDSNHLWLPQGRAIECHLAVGTLDNPGLIRSEAVPEPGLACQPEEVLSSRAQ